MRYRYIYPTLPPHDTLFVTAFRTRPTFTFTYTFPLHHCYLRSHTHLPFYVHWGIYCTICPIDVTFYCVIRLRSRSPLLLTLLRLRRLPRFTDLFRSDPLPDLITIWLRLRVGLFFVTIPVEFPLRFVVDTLFLPLTFGYRYPRFLISQRSVPTVLPTPTTLFTGLRFATVVLFHIWCG